MIRSAIETIGGRRFLLAAGAGVMTTLLQWFGKLDPGGNTYMLVVIGCVGSYIAGNTSQKNTAQKVKGGSDAGTP